MNFKCSFQSQKTNWTSQNKNEGMQKCINYDICRTDFSRHWHQPVAAQEIRCFYICPLFFFFRTNRHFNQLSQYDCDVTSMTASSQCFVLVRIVFFCTPACCESSHCDINHVYRRWCHFEQWKIGMKLNREWRRGGQGSTFFHLQRETVMFFNLQNLLSAKQVRISFHVFALLLRLRLIKKASKPQQLIETPAGCKWVCIHS